MLTPEGGNANCGQMNTSLNQSNIKPSSRLFTSRGAAMSIAATLFFVLCVAPALYMFVISLAGADGRLGFENYQRMFSEARQRELFVNSIALGAGSAVMAVLIGAPLGLLFARANFPLKRLLRIALVAPLVIPPYILALAWIYIGGPAGIVAQLFGRDPLSEWTYSLAGAIVVLGVGFFPLAMLATEAAARRVDGRLEEAALLVAPQSRVLRRITLPLVAPSIVAAALIIFVLAISEFGVPGLLRVNVFTTEVFTAFSALYDFGAATALAIPLLAAAVIAGTAAQFVIGEKLLVTRRGARAGLRLPSEHKTIVVRFRFRLKKRRNYRARVGFGSSLASCCRRSKRGLRPRGSSHSYSRSANWALRRWSLPRASPRCRSGFTR